MTDQEWAKIYGHDGQIAGTGSPVQGLPHVFQRTAERARETSIVADEAYSQVVTLSLLDARKFDGDTAVKLAEAMLEVGESLRVVGPIFRDLARILQHHHDELVQLRRDAEAALARARTAWHARNVAVEDQSAASSHLSTIDREISQVEALIGNWTREMESLPPDDLGSGRIVYSSRIASANNDLSKLYGRRRSALANLNDATRRREQEQAILEAVRVGPGRRSSWHALRRAEKALDDRTASRIGGIDLRGLADPGFVERAFGSIGQWAWTLLSSPFTITAALIRGDGAVAFERFRSFLKAVQTLLVVVAVVAVVVGVVAAIAGAPLLAVAGLAVAKLGLYVAGKIGMALLAERVTRAGQDLAAGQAQRHELTDIAIEGAGKLAGSKLGPFGPLVVMPAEWAVRRFASDQLQAPQRQLIDLDAPIRHDVKSPAELVRQSSLDMSGAVPSDLGRVTPRFCVVVGAARP